MLIDGGAYQDIESLNIAAVEVKVEVGLVSTCKARDQPIGQLVVWHGLVVEKHSGKH